jgi:hypothetical protein
MTVFAKNVRMFSGSKHTALALFACMFFVSGAECIVYLYVSVNMYVCRSYEHKNDSVQTHIYIRACTHLHRRGACACTFEYVWFKYARMSVVCMLKN